MELTWLLFTRRCRKPQTSVHGQ